MIPVFSKAVVGDIDFINVNEAWKKSSWKNKSMFSRKKRGNY